MQAVHHYIRLTEQLQSCVIGQSVPITSAGVANMLCCTPRNAKLILKKLTEHNWLHWQPGRGRGHTSQLTLQIAPADLLFSLAQELVRAGDLRTATQLIEPYRSKYPALHTRYETWLSSHFGFHAADQSGTEALDTLRLTHSNPLFYLDPAIAMLRSELHVLNHIFDTLVICDPTTAEIRPHLAHNWEISDDETCYTFYLRKGVFFHNGAPLTARDAVFSIKRLQNDSLYPWMFAGVRSITALNDLTLQVTLDAPNQLLLQFFSTARASIVPEDYCTAIGADFARLPVGSGPFKVIRNDETMLVCEAFLPYFRERALLDRIEIWIVSDLDLPVAVFEDTIKYGTASADWATTEQLETSFQMLTCNLNKPHRPQQHLAFREALSLLLNKRQLIADLGGDRYAPATRFDVVLEQMTTDTPSDRSQIAALLAQSGYDGEPLLLSTFGDPDHLEDAMWIAETCQAAGVAITIRPLPYREMIQPEQIAAADLILDGATIEDNLELSYLDLFLSSCSFLAPHLSPELRAYTARTIDNLLSQTSREARLDLLRQIESRLLAEHVVLPLYRTWVTVSTHPLVHGVTLNSQGWVDYRNLWFRQK